MKTRINKDDLEQLIRDSVILECLQECGVDNWEGHSDAIQSYRETGHKRESIRWNKYYNKATKNDNE